ncbi:MAG TPA: ElyC/SanA/YdcF family protein [Fimbriimonadaceae bacterium]|nr:ElyC/SanA/YdcF family protein [Fimbriimonadaceae bacterium]
MKKKRKKWRWIVVATMALLGLFVWATNAAVLASAGGRIFADVEKLPTEPVGLVLGTAPYFKGSKNPFFERRMDAAATLYKAHKVAKLLVSGDNYVKTYDEPSAMRDALVARGVPAADIVLDYAGFRTLDSVVRAHKIFGVDRCAIVTDDFHLPRALYIAQSAGIDAVGFQTVPLPRSVGTMVYVREIGSRSLVWLDLHVLNRQPRFLGPRVAL